MDPSPSYPRCHADAILPLLITSKPAETWNDRPFLFRVWNAKSRVWQENKEKAALTAQNTLTGQPHVKCRQYHVTSTYMGTSGREVESACVCPWFRAWLQGVNCEIGRKTRQVVVLWWRDKQWHIDHVPCELRRTVLPSPYNAALAARCRSGCTLERWWRLKALPSAHRCEV